MGLSSRKPAAKTKAVHGRLSLYVGDRLYSSPAAANAASYISGVTLVTPCSSSSSKAMSHSARYLSRSSLSQRVDNGVVTLLLIIVARFLGFIPFVY